MPDGGRSDDSLDPGFPSIEGTEFEEANTGKKTYLTPTGARALEALAAQSGDTQSKLLREAFQEFAIGLCEDPETDISLSSAQLNYLARRRDQRDRLLRQRVANWRRRVDDVIQNRLDWDTEPEVVAIEAEDFRRQARLHFENGLIDADTFHDRLEYLHRQFADYAPAREAANANRENRSAAFAMADPKHAEEYREELGHAVSALIRSTTQSIDASLDTELFSTARGFATDAARMDSAPPDKTSEDIWREVRQLAVEAADTGTDQQSLLNRAADRLAEGQDHRAEVICEMAAEIYPNDLNVTAEELLDRARERAEMPDHRVERTTETDEAVEEVLADIKREADDAATGASPSPGLTGAGTGAGAGAHDADTSLPVANADGGETETERETDDGDGKGQDGRSQ